MKKLKYVLIMIILLIGIGGGYYIVIYKPFDNPSTPIDNSTNNNNDDNSSNDESKDQPIVSKESIEKLAEFKLLNIITSSPTLIEKIDYIPSTNIGININLINGKLYLTTDKQHKSLISNFNEKVIFMIGVGSMMASDLVNVIVLTDKGNLYTLNSDHLDSTIGPFDDNVYTNLQLNEPVTIPFMKLNPDNIKVLAFSKYEDESGGFMNFSPVLYTNQGFKTLNMDNYKIIKSRLGSLYGNRLVVYEDNTIKPKTSSEILKNIHNSDLIVKEIYTISEYYTSFYIIDNNNHLYIEDNDGNLSLYKDSSIKSVKSVDLNTNDSNNKQLTITFQDNTTLKIKYSDFYNALEDTLGN